MSNVWCTNISVYSPGTGEYYSGKSQVTGSGVNGDWSQNHYQCDDYGYIVLGQDIENVTYFTLQPHNQTNDGIKNYTIAGYGTDNLSTMVKDSGPVTTYLSSQNSSKKILYYDIDTFYGQSGAPIYSSNVAVGLHAYEVGGSGGKYCTANKGVYFSNAVIAYFNARG